MKYPTLKCTLGGAIGALMAAAIALPAGAAELPSPTTYLGSSNHQVTRDNYGECWHTSSWTKDSANVVGCDGYTAPKPVEVAAPVAEPAPAPAPAPAPVAEAPAPAPVAPAPVRIEHMTLSADALFGFNKYNLRPAAREKLSALAEKINGEDVHAVRIDGYTDSIGSRAYNLKLSRERAGAVKHFLVQKHVPADVIVARGHGKTHFVASNRTAAGRAKNRRVEVTVEVNTTVQQ